MLEYRQGAGSLVQRYLDVYDHEPGDEWVIAASQTLFGELELGVLLDEIDLQRNCVGPESGENVPRMVCLGSGCSSATRA
jgi:hypothetical protein